MRLTLILSAFLLLGSANARADDWTVVRVRGGVFALDSGQWVQLLRNSVVSDDRVIRSAPGGRATFVRGAETIEVGADTTIQIDDSTHGFTTVYEHSGTVGVDAEARNVQHFAVQTPFVAAVVKGTAFVVETGQASSLVAVSRGTVAVHDEHYGSDVSVHAGSAVASGDEPVTTASVTSIPAGIVQPPAPAAQQPTPAPVTSLPSNAKDPRRTGDASDGNTSDPAPNKESGSSDKGGAHSGNGSSGGKGGKGNSEENGHGTSTSGEKSGGSHGSSGNGNSESHDNSGGGHGNSGAHGNGNSSSHGNSGNGNSSGHDGNENSGSGNGNGNSGHGNSGNDSGHDSAGSGNENGNSSNHGNSGGGNSGNGNGNGNSSNDNGNGKGKGGK